MQPQPHPPNPTYHPWHQISTLSPRNPRQHNTTFQSHGDWNCHLYQMPKDQLTYQTLLGKLQQFTRFQFMPGQRQVVPEIKTFQQAIGDCGLKAQHLERFMAKRGIEGDVEYYERLRDDGNTKISVFWGKSKLYIVVYDTS